MHPDIYPVGALKTMLMVRSALRHRNWRGAWNQLGHERRTIQRIIRFGKWRALKNHFNGYLCEPNPFPRGVTRCGSGWTKRRAARSMDRQILRAAR